MGGLLGVAGELGKSVLSSPLLTEIFKWVTARPESKEKAKPHVLALYKDLLQIQSCRNDLMEALQEQLSQTEKGKGSNRTLKAVERGAQSLSGLLKKFEKDCRSLAVALDQASHSFATNRRKYIGEQSAAVRPLKAARPVDLGRVSAILEVWKRNSTQSSEPDSKDLENSYKRLVANTGNFNQLLTTYRDFVKRNYPNALDLVS